MARVQIAGLRVRYGATLALDGLDLEIASGEIFSLLGASGSGKTSLLRAIAGFLRPLAGQIDFLGRDEVLDADHVSDMTPLDAVLYYADSHLRLLDQDVSGRAYFMLMAGAVADASSLQAAFAASHERVRQWLADRVRAGQGAGQIRGGIDPDGAALMVGSLLLGVSIQWLADPATPLGLIRRTSLALLRDSLSPYPAQEPYP